MGLSIKQIKAARLLASGSSVTDVAKKVGVTRATIHNYQKSQDFKETVKMLATEQAALAVAGDVDVEQSRADELALREYIRPLAEY